MKKYLFSLILAVQILTGQSQVTISWSDTFTNSINYGSSKMALWNNFRNDLDTSLNYSKITISGTYDPTGISCTDPVIVKNIAKAIAANTNLNITSCDGNVWHICHWGGDYFDFWINAPSNCDGSNCPDPGYIIRPGIGNVNWGGINTATCWAPSQRMNIVFEIADCPALSVTAITNASSSTSNDGSISINLSDPNSSIRYLRWASKEGINYPSTNQEDVTGLAPGSYYLFVVTTENEPCYLGPVTVGP